MSPVSTQRRSRRIQDNSLAVKYSTESCPSDLFLCLDVVGSNAVQAFLALPMRAIIPRNNLPSPLELVMGPETERSQAGRTTPARPAGTAQGRDLIPRLDGAGHAIACKHTWDEPCGRPARAPGRPVLGPRHGKHCFSLTCCCISGVVQHPRPCTGRRNREQAVDKTTFQQRQQKLKIQSRRNHTITPHNPQGSTSARGRAKSERLAITDFPVRQRDFRDASVASTVAHVAARPSSPRGSGPGPWLACCVIGSYVR